MVWANPRSLATTRGITFVFFSSGYLDVSVHQVSFLIKGYLHNRWVYPFGNLRIKALLQLT